MLPTFIFEINGLTMKTTHSEVLSRGWNLSHLEDGLKGLHGP